METARSFDGVDESSGGRLASVDGRTLPLKGVRLEVEARGGIARVRLKQRFVNPYEDPLAVTYQFPLPSDGAVSGFSFHIGDKRIIGEVDRLRAARERYERALIEGYSAALVEQQRSSLFVQEIGNIPPKTEVLAELIIDQRLAWIDDEGWEWRFPTTVAPRYQGGPGRVTDAARTRVEVADGELAPRLLLSLAIGDALAADRRPESPSHRLRFSDEAGRLAAVFVDEQGVALDRDVVVRWPVAAPQVALALGVGRPAAGKPHAGSAFGLLTVVPPAPESRPEPMPRDLIVLIDTSGSMSGEPLSQAKAVVSALIDSLTERDRLDLIEFSNRARRFKAKAVQASPAHRKEARAWVEALRAGGGTEMRDGVLEALAPLRREAQRQVVLVTDGLVGFEGEIVGAILAKLPANSRFHAVGVGSATNRSLTSPVARVGRGVEVLIGLGEDPERAVQRLLARTVAPLVTELEISGDGLRDVAPARLPDLFAGAPALISLALNPEGGELLVRGRAPWGEWKERVRWAPVEHAGCQEAVSLFGRERVEDLEMRIASGESSHALDEQIAKVGIDFQLSTRLTSWVAVSEEKTVDPRQPLRRERVAQSLPYGMSAEGLGLRAASDGVAMMMTRCGAASMPFTGMAREALALGVPPSSTGPERTRRAFVKPTRRQERVEEQARSGPGPTLRGRVVLCEGRELVVEITVGAEGLEWDPSTGVEVLWEKLWRRGVPVEAQIDPSRTTAPGFLVAGQVVRLAVRLAQDAPKGKPRYIHLTCNGVQRVVELQG